LPNRRGSFALLVALAVLGGCASARTEEGAAPIEEKSPFAATLMAIFPGFFVHGAGNWYAGKVTRRDELLEEEGLGLGAMALGAGMGGLGYFEHLEANRSKSTFEMVLNRMGEVGSFIGCGGFLGYGLVCFFDSWIRDMIEAGDAAEARNRDLRRNRDLYPPLKPDTSAVDSITPGRPDLPPSMLRTSERPR